MVASVMSSPSGSRKRPAPGSLPMSPMMQFQPPLAAAQADPILKWNAGPTESNSHVDSGPRGLQPCSPVAPPSPYAQGQAQAASPPSTALARRGIDQALVATGRGQAYSASPEIWGQFGDNTALVPQQHNGHVAESDSIEHLEELAQKAKREAQAKRKQIPPFVQKLSSFLDESRNTDLIRWSDKGDSFVVLDEDEFAKTLIPELFKHNNYASFVRQLNMYGFHKRVGLSDNSMKASERKNKSPSEYYNPYFRRGHPNLLWLINKPKGGNGKKKGKKEEGVEGDSEAEDAVVDDSLQVPSYVSAPVGGGRPLANEVGPPQRKDLAQVKNEVDRLQQQQLAISDMLNKLRRDHIALSQQAVQFQNQHNRHEQSINAILTFLANVFRKSLEEQGGTQTVQDLLANVIPGPQMHGQSHQMSQGSVFDLGDLFKQDSGSPAINQITRTQRLLPAAPQGVGEAGTISPPPMPSPLPQSTGITPPPMGTVTELLDNPQTSEHELQSHRLESIKRIIQDTNASKGSLSLSELAANSSRVDTTGISRTEASNMAAAMAAPLSGTTATVSDPSPAAGLPSPLLPGSAAGLSLSPIFSSISPPNLHDIQATDEEIEALQQSLQGQSHKIEEITSLLNPLSPSGRTSGLGAESITGDYFDINQFLDANAFSGLEYNIGTGSVGLAADAGGNDFNFSLDGAGDLKPAGTVPVAGVDSGGGTYPTGRIMEPTSPNSSGDSPSTTGTLGTEEVVRSDVDGPALVHKRRRVG